MKTFNEDLQLGIRFLQLRQVIIVAPAKRHETSYAYLVTRDEWHYSNAGMFKTLLVFSTLQKSNFADVKNFFQICIYLVWEPF